jgi:putative DNA primase/helicase
MNSASELATLLGARKCGNCFIADCPSCGYPRALSIRPGHSAALITCHAGCSRERVIRAIPGYAVRRMPGTQRPPDREISAPPSERAQEFARVLWHRTLPASGSPVQAYLTARGITAPIPVSLRFLCLRHSPTGGTWPCMVAAVARWPGSKIVAVHRTYLSGSQKAPVDPCRMTLGPVAGGAVRLAPASEVMGVAEGIETALSAMQVSGIPVWAALSAGGIERLILPALPQARTLIIFADHDPRGLEAAQKAAARWRDEGREVVIEVPPLPGQDFNDLLNMQITRAS